MPRYVEPRQWIDVHRVEHPPLMIKQLVQAVCGGVRWLETKMLGEHLATRAVEHGMAANQEERRALGVPTRLRLSKRHSLHDHLHSHSIVARMRKKRQIDSTSFSQDLSLSRLPLSRTFTKEYGIVAGNSCKVHKDGAHEFNTLHSHERADVQLGHTEAKLKRSRMNSVSEWCASSHNERSCSFSSISASRFLMQSERLATYDVLDCTFGSGYHSGAILKNGKPYTRVVAMDVDCAASVFAKNIARKFGNDRFRFFNSRMSNILSVFGESAFDAIMIDPGLSMTQIMDPARGFGLSEDLHLVDGEHSFDLRYGSDCGLDALSFLNTVPQHALAHMLSSYKMLTAQQSMKLARAVRMARPLRSSTALLSAIQSTCNSLPEEGWQSQSSRRRSPMSLNFFASLRSIVNHEMYEFREALNNALLVLRSNGRVVVFTRTFWEEAVVETTVAAHPYAFLSYSEAIESSEVQEYGHARHIKLWVVVRTQNSNFVHKNNSLSLDEVRESTIRWLSGAFASQTHGFPACNATFHDASTDDKHVMNRNAQLPPLDNIDDFRN